MATPPEVGQRHGLKQSKSVRTRYPDNHAVRGREQQLLKRIERRPAIASGVGFNDQAAEESTDAGNEDANVFPSAETDRLAANDQRLGFLLIENPQQVKVIGKASL